MTALMLCGYVALFLAQRRNRGAWLVPMGFCFAFAASIKPTIAPLPILLLLFTLWPRFRQREVWLPWLGWAVLGMLVPVVMVLGYLEVHHTFAQFVQLQRSITAYYAQLSNYTMREMVMALFDYHIVNEILALALLLRLRPNRPAWTQEQWLLLLGAGFGVLSFLLQRKNFGHHRYIFLMFLLLLAGIEIMQALRARTGVFRWAAAAMALYIALRFVPADAQHTRDFRRDSALVDQLVVDLQGLDRTSSLQRRVVCLDQVYGCLNAMYQLRLVENAPLSGDMLLFADSRLPVIEHARDFYRQTQAEHPADLLVVTNQNFLNGPDFNKHNDYKRIAYWPEYQAVIASQYRLLAERSFPCEKGYQAKSAHRYRLYARLGSDLAAVQMPAQPMETCPAAPSFN